MAKKVKKVKSVKLFKLDDEKLISLSFEVSKKTSEGTRKGVKRTITPVFVNDTNKPIDIIVKIVRPSPEIALSDVSENDQLKEQDKRGDFEYRVRNNSATVQIDTVLKLGDDITDLPKILYTFESDNVYVDEKPVEFDKTADDGEYLFDSDFYFIKKII